MAKINVSELVEGQQLGWLTLVSFVPYRQFGKRVLPGWECIGQFIKH